MARELEERERAGSSEKAKSSLSRLRKSASKTATSALAGGEHAAPHREIDPDQIRVEYRTTPLHDAAAAGNAPELERLLRMPEAPLWMVQQDSLGWLPLHYAALIDDECVVELHLPRASVQMALNQPHPEDAEDHDKAAGKDAKAAAVYLALRRACVAENWGDVKCLTVTYQGTSMNMGDASSLGSAEVFHVVIAPYRPLEMAVLATTKVGTALQDDGKPGTNLTSIPSSAFFRAATPDILPPAEGTPAPHELLPNELQLELAKAVRGAKSEHIELALKLVAYVTAQGRPPPPPSQQPEKASEAGAGLERRGSRIGLLRRLAAAKEEVAGPAAPAVEQVVSIDPALYGGRARVRSQRDAIRCVHALADARSDVNCRDLVKATPLHKACANGRLAIACALILRGAKLDAADAYGDTSLHRVAWNSQVTVAKLLLGYGCPVDVVNHQQETGLHYAALVGNLEMMRVLLEHGANVIQRNVLGLSTLHVAVKGGSRSAIEATRALFAERGLLWKDAVTTLNGDNPIHVAVRAGHFSIIDWMIQKGFGRSMARTNKFGDTPAGTALRLAKKFKAKSAKTGGKGAKKGKKGGKGTPKRASSAGGNSRPNSASRVGADSAQSVDDPTRTPRPGSSKRKGKASKKGKNKSTVVAAEPEDLVDTDVSYVPLDTKRVEALLEAADWMSKKEKGFLAEVAAADKAKEIPVKKK